MVKTKTVNCTGPAAKLLPWKYHNRYHFVSYVMHISGVKFEEHHSNISTGILDSVLVEQVIMSSLSLFA